MTTKDEDNRVFEYWNETEGHNYAGPHHLAWDAACAYKDKRIEELERYINELKDLLGWTREIHISEGGEDTCKWIEDSNGWTHTSCGATPFKINPYPTEEQMCGHCRKPIRISEGGAE